MGLFRMFKARRLNKTRRMFKTRRLKPAATYGGQWGSKKGFTLIELVITMLIISIIAYIASNAIFSGTNAFLKTDFKKEALDQARIAMERMTREIRNLRSSADVGTGTGSEFCFINIDGTRVDFRYEGTNIRRLEGGAACPGAAGSGDILAANVTAFSPGFEYIRATGAVDAVFSAVNTKRIRITLTATVSGEAVQLQSEVWPRSL